MAVSLKISGSGRARAIRGAKSRDTRRGIRCSSATSKGTTYWRLFFCFPVPAISSVHAQDFSFVVPLQWQETNFSHSQRHTNLKSTTLLFSVYLLHTANWTICRVWTGLSFKKCNFEHDYSDTKIHRYKIRWHRTDKYNAETQDWHPFMLVCRKCKS